MNVINRNVDNTQVSSRLHREGSINYDRHSYNSVTHHRAAPGM